MIEKKMSDRELMKILHVDEKTLRRFREIQRDTIKEAKQLIERKRRGMNNIVVLKD